MVVASIDLQNGKAVQLQQGERLVVEKDDPEELARQFSRYGDIAIIDLDAAKGRGDNHELIKQLIRVGDCRVGGGIRTVKQAREYLAQGAKKVIIGSLAFKDDRINTTFLEELRDAVGAYRVIIAIDARDGEIVTQGWKHHTGLPLMEVIGQVEPYCSEFLYTRVEREGMLAGVDVEAVGQVARATKNKVTFAGGVAAVDEIVQLAALEVDVQVGMALYTGRIELDDCFIASLNWKSELLPVVTQDEAGRVLMLAYTNREALARTFASGCMTYFSRSRNTLWQKGETSGHTQKLIKLRTDCDRDTILATVRQTGVACHTGSYSCFGDKSFLLSDLYGVIAERFANPRPGSYTATLTNDLVRAKLMEEAQEVVEASKHADVVWEAADVLYFLTVLLNKEGVTIDEVLGELFRRRSA